MFTACEGFDGKMENDEAQCECHPPVCSRNRCKQGTQENESRETKKMAIAIKSRRQRLWIEVGCCFVSKFGEFFLSAMRKPIAESCQT